MAKNEWDDEELPVEDPTLVEDKSGQLIIQDPNVSKKFAQVDRKEQELVEEKIKQEAEESQATESAPEKKSKKGLIAGAVVVAVLAGAGLTFLGGEDPAEQADVQNVQSEENATPVEVKQEVAEATSFEMPAQEVKEEVPAVPEVVNPAPVVEQVAPEQKEVTTAEQPAVEAPKVEAVESQKVEEPVKQEVAEAPTFEMPAQEVKVEAPAVTAEVSPVPVVEQVVPEQKEVTTAEQPAVETSKVETTETQKVEEPVKQEIAETPAVEMPNGESPRAGESAVIESAPALVVEQVAPEQKEVTTAEQPAVEAPKSEVGDVVEQVAHPDLVKQVDEISNKLLVLAEGTQQGFLLFQDNIQKLGAWNGKQDGIIQALHEGHVDVLKRLDALEKKVSSLEEEKAGLIKKIDELDQWKVDKRHRPTATPSKSTVAPAQVQAQKVAKKESNYVVFDDEKKTAKIESQHVAKKAKVKTAMDSTKVEQVEGNQTQSASAPVEKESAQLRSVFNGLAWVTVNGHSKTYMIGDTLMGSKIGAIDNTGIYDTLGNKMLDLR